MIKSLSVPAADQPETLYRRLENALRSAIQMGEYSVGELMPTEAELCERFQVSRHTVREALRRLSELGLVERRQGRGTRVIAVSPKSTYIQTMHSLHELTQYALDTHFEIRAVGICEVSEEEAACISAQPGTRWVKIEGVRWITQGANEAICVTSVYAHVRFALLLRDVQSATGPIYRLIENRSGEIIEEAIQEVSACLLLKHMAASLGAEAGTPALRFVRRYLDASGSPMLTSVNWHPADRFVYRMRLKRDEAETS